MVASQKPNGFSGVPAAAQRRFGVGLEHRGFGGWLVVPARLEHEHPGAIHGQRIGGLTARGARADDDHVIGVLVGFCG